MVARLRVGVGDLILCDDGSEKSGVQAQGRGVGRGGVGLSGLGFRV